MADARRPRTNRSNSFASSSHTAPYRPINEEETPWPSSTSEGDVPSTDAYMDLDDDDLLPKVKPHYASTSLSGRSRSVLGVPEESLQYALIAAPIQPTTRIPDIDTLQATIQNVSGYQLKIETIIAYPPDYILRFETPHERAAIEKHQILNGPTFTLALEQWSPNYRANIITRFNTKVTIDILGIPAHIVSKKRISSALAQFCDVETCSFDPKTGICHVDALTCSQQFIPKIHTLPVKKRMDNITQCSIYSIRMHTYLRSEAPSLGNNTASNYSHTSYNQQLNNAYTNTAKEPQHSSMGTAIEFGVDKEIADEAWKDNCRREDAFYAGLNPDDLFFTGYDTDLHGSQGWESDRSWHFH